MEQPEEGPGLLAPPSPDGLSRLEAVSSPTPLLGLAAVATLCAWAILPIASQPLHLVGWALGSLVTIGFVTAYSAIDAKRSQSTLYTSFPAADRVRSIIAVVGVAAAVVHTFYFATKVAS